MNIQPHCPVQSSPAADLAGAFGAEIAQCVSQQSLVGAAILENERFIYVNARFAAMFGYQPEAMLTIPAIETVAYSSRLRANQYLRECLEGQNGSETFECEGVKRDGSPIYLEICGSRAEVAGRECVACLVSDVTAKTLAERKVQALNRRLAELAVRDPLTGLYNRRFMEASLERELLEAERNGVPLSLVLCDIDHFKAINDAFGHEAGDEVLKALGSLLKRRCRRSDLACRYGGEEFLVVFPGMPGEIAKRWAESIRETVAGGRVATSAKTLQITASFGVATYPENGQTWTDLIAAADSAQYAAKTTGRDQVVTAPPVAEPAPADPAHIAARAG